MGKMTGGELCRVVSLYEGGKSCREIGLLLGRGVETVRRGLRGSGVVMRGYRDYYACDVDDGYFERIDTCEKAYWFGFILADGCISWSAGDLRGFYFNLQRRDRESIVDFRSAIGYSGGVRDFVSRRGDRVYLKSGICFNNKVFCGNLLRLGWVEFKKNDDPSVVFGNVGGGFMRHFVRGFFDGDGCISRSKSSFKSFYVHFSGSWNVLSAFRDVIVSGVGLPFVDVKRSNFDRSSRLVWRGNRQVCRFGRWLYDGSSVFMLRKYDRFCCLFRHYGGVSGG